VSVALHHAVEGPADAPVLLLGNSLGTSLAMWDRVRPLLVDQVRVVGFDHRGQGASPEPPGPYAIEELGADVLALLDTLGAQRATYCGVSIGGMVGLWLAAHAPERVDRLVACCTSAHLGPPEPWIERARVVREAGSTAPIADAVVARWVTPAFAAAHLEVTDELRAMLLASPPEGYAACCAALARVDLRASLGGVTAPTLVVAGTQDEAIPAEHSERIAGGIPGARLVRLEAAHIPMAERPQQVADLILGHLGLRHRPLG